MIHTTPQEIHSAGMWLLAFLIVYYELRCAAKIKRLRQARFTRTFVPPSSHAHRGRA